MELLISTVIATSYVAYIWSKYGVLGSISDSYYHTNNPWLFAFFIWGTAIPLMIAGNTALMFLAGAILCFVGASPAFKKDMEGKVHVFGAMTGISLGFVSMWVDFGLWYLSVAFVSFYLYAKFTKLKNETWWVEIVAVILILIGLIIK